MSGKFNRDDIYKNESQINERLGEHYNNTQCHRMKDKNTFSTVFPTSVIEFHNVMKTTNKEMEPISFKVDDLDKRHFFKMDANKRYNVEMAKAINLDKLKKANENKVENK